MKFYAFIRNTLYQIDNFVGQIVARIKAKLIPYDQQVNRIKALEDKAKIISESHSIPFSFQCEILHKPGEKFNSIGFSDTHSPKVDGKYKIYIYSKYVMINEEQILLTIFHEMGHYIFQFSSISSSMCLIRTYSTNSKFPKLTRTGDFVEDFCELFAYLMLGKITVDDEIIIVVQKMVKSSIPRL